MKSKQVWMKSKPYGFDEIKSVFSPPQAISSAIADFIHEVDLFRRKTDLVKKSTNLVSRLVLFSGCGTRIRTQTNRVRVCRATFTQFRNILLVFLTTLYMISHQILFVNSFCQFFLKYSYIFSTKKKQVFSLLLLYFYLPRFCVEGTVTSLLQHSNISSTSFFESLGVNALTTGTITSPAIITNAPQLIGD